MSTRYSILQSLWRPRTLVACLVATMAFVCTDGAQAQDDFDPFAWPVESYEKAPVQIIKVPINPEDYLNSDGSFNWNKYKHDLKHNPEKFEDGNKAWWLWWLANNTTDYAQYGNAAPSDGDGNSSDTDNLWSDVNLEGATPEEPALPLLPPSMVGYDPGAAYPRIPDNPSELTGFGQFGGGFGPVRPGSTAITGGR